jgi:Kef-type K+ transport system membrane component KefB
MVEMNFFQDLGVIVVAAAVLVMLGRLIRMPAIVVYLLTGLLIGPLLGWVEMSAALDLISEKGIVLLLFLVGLELSLQKIRDVGKVAVVAGIGQMLLMTAAAFGVSRLLGIAAMEGLFLAVALTFSSTVVVVKLLDEKGQLASLHGRMAVGVLLVQDVVVILMLTFLAGMSAGADLDGPEMAWKLAKSFAGMGVLLAGALLASRYLFPKPFHWAARSPDMLLIWALSWCFVLVTAAHHFGLSLEIGAFLAGLSLAQLPYNENLRRRVHPLMNLFVAVFFVSLGVRMDAEGTLANWFPAVVFAVLILLGKPLFFYFLIRRTGYARQPAGRASRTLAQISEFSFIIAGMGLASGLIGSDALAITALVGVLTIAISSYMITYDLAVYGWLERRGWLDWKIFRARESVASVEPGAHGAPLSGHIIVVGMNTLGRDLVRRLHERGEQTLAIDTDPRKLVGLPGDTLLGSVEYLSVLQEAGLERAKLLVSALRIEDANNMLAYRCQSLGVPSAIHVIDLSVVDGLLDLDVDYLMIPKVDGMKSQMAKLKEMGVVES